VEKSPEIPSFLLTLVEGRFKLCSVTPFHHLPRERPLGGLAVSSTKTINKADLVSMVADKTEMSKTDAATAVDSVLDAITSALKKGMEVRLVGFGNFYVNNRKAGEGRNPQTGEKIKIPASKQPKFKAGKGLKDAIN
jgi:DNA-binding protein HU-beta